MPPRKPRYVFSRTTTLVVDGSGRHHLRAGDAWHADHPLVEAHPDWFSDEPIDVKPRNWVPRAEEEQKVEQATKAPGEKRNTRRDD